MSLKWSLIVTGMYSKCVHILEIVLTLLYKGHAWELLPLYSSTSCLQIPHPSSQILYKMKLIILFLGLSTSITRSAVIKNHPSPSSSQRMQIDFSLAYLSADICNNRSFVSMWPCLNLWYHKISNIFSSKPQDQGWEYWGQYQQMYL